MRYTIAKELAGALLRPLASLAGSSVAPGSPQGWSRLVAEQCPDGEADKVSLTVATTEVAVAVTAELPASVEEAGEAVIETALFARALPLEQGVSVEVSATDRVVSVGAVLTHPALREVPVGLTPVAVPQDAVFFGTFQTKDFVAAVRAAAKIPPSGTLGRDGVQLKVSSEDDAPALLKVVATDSYTLSVEHLTPADPPGPGAEGLGVVVPRKTIKAAAALMAQPMGAAVRLYAHRGNLYLAGGSITARIRGIQGAPDYASMVTAMEVEAEAETSLCPKAWAKICAAVAATGEYLFYQVTPSEVRVSSAGGVGACRLEGGKIDCVVPVSAVRRVTGAGQVALNAAFASNAYAIATTGASSSSGRLPEEEEDRADKEAAAEQPLRITLGPLKRGTAAIFSSAATPARKVYLAGIVLKTAPEEA